MNSLSKRADGFKKLMLDAERYLWQNPETGYFEYKTDKYMAEKFEELGYQLTKAGDIPGFYTVLDTGRSGPTLLIFAELDALIIDSHPECDKETKAVHACCHHAQCAALLGVAAVLKEKDALEGLSGKIKLCVVPAEEGIQLEEREKLRKQGVIHYCSGKQEFLRRGFFDDCDLAFMLHAAFEDDDKLIFRTVKGSNGVLRKIANFKGKPAHAGGRPQDGINALYAASHALSAINALRETFVDDDHIRVHPIIKKGGSSVNAIPDRVVIETYVRGANIEAIKAANKKINRAIAGSAAAMGAGVYVTDMTGSMPLKDDAELQGFAEALVRENFGADSVLSSGAWQGSSTDMGDITSVMPAMHGYVVGGVEGRLHTDDLRITDAERITVDSAKLQLCFIEGLLKGGAKEAKRIVEKAKGRYTKIPDLIQTYEELNMEKELVIYSQGKTELLI